MVKRLTLILVAALIVGLAIPAYAEVQNIKVSGDILVTGVARGNTDLSAGDQNRVDDQVSATLSTVRLRVDADLTENVSAVVRLINERVWSEKIEADGGANTDDTKIDLDLAYMTLKEFLYSPLTLVIGRQNLRYGTGFIVGDPDTNQVSEYNHNSGTQADTIVPEDMSSMKAFDAVKAILNYDPLVIDLLWAKIDEGLVLGNGTNPESDDIDLYGINVAYDWGTSKGLMTESYVFVKEAGSDSSELGVVVADENNDRVITLGTRASLMPLEKLYLSGEFAWQMGKNYITSTNSRDRDAFAFQVISQYALDMKYSPVLTATFTHYSGDEDAGTGSESGEFNAWDPMFEDQAGGKIYNALFPASNCNSLELKGQITPIEDVSLSLEYAALWLDEAFADTTGAGGSTTTWNASDIDGGTYTMNLGKKALGHEIDLVLTYDYTEDVQFGLNAGIFMPGDAFATSNRDNAHQVLGSVKVSF